MTRTFVMTREFGKNWKAMGLTRENLSKAGRNAIASMIAQLEKSLKG